MRNDTHLLTLGAVILGVASLSAAPDGARAHEVDTSIARFVRPFVAEAAPPDAPSVAIADDDASETDALADYVLDAMRAWNRGPMAGTASRLPAIARDIAHVALHEPRVWPGSDGAREAILLAGIAWWETRFRDYVDDGSCNRWAREAYRRTGRLKLKVLAQKAQELMAVGTCDGGLAASVWQIHFGSGIVLDDRGGWHLASSREVGITHEMALEDRKHAARVALAIARQSIQAGVGLENYVGGGDAIARRDKARARLGFVERYSRAHPFTSKVPSRTDTR